MSERVSHGGVGLEWPSPRIVIKSVGRSRSQENRPRSLSLLGVGVV